METNSPEFQAALRDHARSLGVDPDAESHLLSLVQEALLAEVPDGWEQGETEDGSLYYFNADTDESIWEHPLDAHYRELLKQKKAQGTTPAPPAAKATEPPPIAEVSKLEVYSFDEDSDDDNGVQPASRAAAASDRSSRLSALFTPQPAPSFSSAVTTSVKDAVLGRSTASTANSTTTTTGTPTPSSGGFGRDRSWLLDNDDADVTPLARPITATAVSSVASFASRASLSETKDVARPTTATSSLSYTSRLFGGTTTNAASASASASAPLELGGAALGAPAEKGSPRRGIASAIKGPFFQDMAADPTMPLAAASSTVSASASNSTVDTGRLKELEKTNAELTKQVDQLKKDAAAMRQQLETARQDAKEANYLKMKANETKAKLAESEAELARARQDAARLESDVQRLQDECGSLRQTQKTATQQEILDAKKAASELQVQLDASHKQASAADLALQQSRRECETLEAQLRDLSASLERERRDNAVLKEQGEADAKEARAMRDQVDKTKQESREQLDTLRQELSTQTRQVDGVHALQDSLARQTKLATELEDKLTSAMTKAADAEAREAATVRDSKLKDGDLQDLHRKLASVTLDLEARDRQLRELADTLRQEQSHSNDVQSKAATLRRSEDEFARRKQELELQLRDRSDQLHGLQSQLLKAQDEAASATAKLQAELHARTTELKQIKSLQVLPLEKQRDQLAHDSERLSEKLAAVEEELRSAQQELATQASTTHQLQVEIEAWKRKEQQQKAQKEAYLHEKMASEKQLQSLQGELSAYRHEKRLEVEKMAFRLRELESQVAQKDYEIVRVEEKFTKAEAWRLKEARRVEVREAQLLDLKEELAQLRSRHIEAENNLIIHELRREKEQLDGKLKALAQELEDERVARQVAAQQFRDEAENLHKAVEWQLPQLAAACVSRSSDEWTRKCNELVSALRDNWSLKALAERNELVQRLKQVDERRDHVEQKLKNATAESEFLRKEVHRVEDNNKVLLDQLHTIRVYMTQRAGASVFPTMATMGASSAQVPPPPAAPAPAPAPPAPPVYSDVAAVNQLNAQLSVLHAQFQQLFDAHAEPSRRPKAPVTFSPPDRFEMPMSPSSQSHKRADSYRDSHRHRDSHGSPLNTSSSTISSTCSSSHASSLDETLDALLLDRNLTATAKGRDPHREKEQLLATLESLGSSRVVAVVPLEAADTQWYQQNYWRSKYQQQHH